MDHMLICCCCGEILAEEIGIVLFAGADDGPDEDQVICPDCWEEGRRWRGARVLGL